MALDKKEIVLSIAGILASAAVAFLIYRLQQRDAAQNAANLAAEDQSQVADQQQQIASLPGVSVPSISASPSTSDSTPSDTTDASDSELESIIASMLSQDNSSVTSASTPIATVAILPQQTQPTIAPVVIPTVNNFASSYSTTTPPNSTEVQSHNGLNTNLRTA